MIDLAKDLCDLYGLIFIVKFLSILAGIALKSVMLEFSNFAVYCLQFSSNGLFKASGCFNK